MKLRGLALVAAAMAFAAGMGKANASFAIKNSFSGTVFVGYTFRELCDSNICSNTGSFNGWRSRGWFKIAPGGTATLYGSDFRNRRHFWGADDFAGHHWNGTGGPGGICVTSAAYDMCTIKTRPCPEFEHIEGEENNPGAGCCSIFCGLATSMTVNLR